MEALDPSAPWLSAGKAPWLVLRPERLDPAAAPGRREAARGSKGAAAPCPIGLAPGHAERPTFAERRRGVGQHASVTALGLVVAFNACGDPGSNGMGADVVQSEPQALGASCREDEDCISRLCMVSQYGTPFCTRPCPSPWEPCPAGDDAAAGASLCVSFESPPNPQAPAFQGELTRFCVPRCADVRECAGVSAAWEACDVPKWLGDPLFPALGQQRVCQSPSFHGKVPVDPTVCDWERTVKGANTNEANLCRAYCSYMSRCKELDDSTATKCCEWGCFNRIVIEDTVQVAWRDRIRCYIDNHAAFPETGPRNACTEPPVACGGEPPDPTPPAARD